MDSGAHHDPSSSTATMTEQLKRKRSPSHDAAAQAPPAPPPKTAKTSNHLQINYLARQYTEDLPLISGDDTLPNILQLLGEYQGVLDRHESMACNLGARPLGPILIKRFERLFDGPPKVLKSHGKDPAHVTWLDVVEFARNKPEQFTLGQMSEGVRVCQFYTKQCRVQISEEDFVLISSGIPQKMIPPQPIVEDEEKELGTLEILEKNLAQICQLADQVAARTRQLNHRLKGRKQAILDRRATNSPAAVRASSPSNVALMNGLGQNANAALAALSKSPSGGFVAVNSRPPAPAAAAPEHDPGRNGASSATRNELMNKFSTINDRRTHGSNGDQIRRGSSASQYSAGGSASGSKSSARPPGNTSGGPNGLPYSDSEYAQLLLSNTSPVPIPSTPSQLLPSHGARPGSQHPPTAEKDDGGPFKAEMVARMEVLSKGERILPPCDRCRRLHMDCLKNLTACMGCTKKHAKCSWKEVREPELRMTQPPPEGEATHSDIEMGGYPGSMIRQNLASPASASPSASVGSVGGHAEARAAGQDANAGHLTPGQAAHSAELSRHEGRLSVGGAPEARMEDRQQREPEQPPSHAAHAHHEQQHQQSHGQMHDRREPPEAVGAHPAHPERHHQEQPHQSDLQSLVA
ncbi:hypothetical protein DIS24_g9659 [Lasiodiplodia hormozganensis]|uniref:Zn(2)-C6 fungal-type domain-containing protein n=1 Tax=Lasiodiplodia hormozganensis TaxID=869390 RepID=A0AA39XTU8_9PEZI|nr:hypothetical protein DIS24_g9659 [Lasiodiplodia hormozganensis]